jgi:hypothetical protein
MKRSGDRHQVPGTASHTGSGAEQSWRAHGNLRRRRGEMRQLGRIGDDVYRLDTIVVGLHRQRGAGLSVEGGYWSAYRLAVARSRRNSSAVRRGP